MGLLLPVGLTDFTKEAVVEKTIKLNPEAKKALENQLEQFIKKFGREPSPGDPVFFDPDKDVPTPLNPTKVRAQLFEAMKAANFTKKQREAWLKLFGFD